MALGIECLLSDDPQRAAELAATLERINAQRRNVQQDMTDAAEAALSRTHLDAGAPPLAPCLFDPDWHPGVVGLVASKMKERLHRPVLAFAPSEPGSSVLRGSARSIPGFHIRDALAATLARPLVRQHIAIAGIAARIQEGRLVDESTLGFIETGLLELVDEIRWLALRSGEAS